MCTAALGMDNTLGDALAVEMGDEIHEMEILEQQWTIFTSSLHFIWVSDRCSIAKAEGVS